MVTLLKLSFIADVIRTFLLDFQNNTKRNRTTITQTRQNHNIILSIYIQKALRIEFCDSKSLCS